jgi:hypothetical protein
LSILSWTEKFARNDKPIRVLTTEYDTEHDAEHHC